MRRCDFAWNSLLRSGSRTDRGEKLRSTRPGTRIRSLQTGHGSNEAPNSACCRVIRAQMSHQWNIRIEVRGDSGF